MLKFIEDNQDNSFLVSIKDRIKETGSLTTNQYNAVWIMMHPFMTGEERKIDAFVYPVKFKIEEGYYGWQYTVVAITETGEKVNIFFSSVNDQKELVLKGAKVLEIDGYGNRNGRSYIKLDNPIHVKGTFDGYKIKRAKISSVEDAMAEV